jgi:hypothetical protein
LLAVPLCKPSDSTGVGTANPRSISSLTACPHQSRSAPAMKGHSSLPARALPSQQLVLPRIARSYVCNQRSARHQAQALPWNKPQDKSQPKVHDGPAPVFKLPLAVALAGSAFEAYLEPTGGRCGQCIMVLGRSMRALHGAPCMVCAWGMRACLLHGHHPQLVTAWSTVSSGPMLVASCSSTLCACCCCPCAAEGFQEKAANGSEITFTDQCVRCCACRAIACT